MDDEEHGYDLRLAFDSDDPEFVRGFEAGRLDALIGCDPHSAFGFIFHATNVEMVLRIAESHGLSLKAESLDEEWMVLRDG